jgi:hypothetical protein
MLIVTLKNVLDDLLSFSTDLLFYHNWTDPSPESRNHCPSFLMKTKKMYIANKKKMFEKREVSVYIYLYPIYMKEMKHISFRSSHLGTSSAIPTKCHNPQQCPV